MTNPASPRAKSAAPQASPKVVPLSPTRRIGRLPIMRPLLPTAEMIAPYLNEIDRNRWYSNFGPLMMRFEEQLAQLLNVPASALASFSSGTAAIYTVLRAMGIEEGTLCLCPSWTFVATPAAPTAVGLHPFFLDVEEKSWSLEPEHVKEQLRYVPGKVGAVIVVAPFGAPFDTAKWDAFTDETGIPVVIDAAAAFDAVANIPASKPGRTPIMVSLHATKTFGIGEGGIILTHDKQLLHRARQLSNYGFKATREIAMPGLNSKLSEYGAAVGLAALQWWPEKRAMWETLTRRYMDAFEACGCGHVTHRLSRDWVSSTLNVTLPTPEAETVIEQLAHAGIESRKWWWKGCHQQEAYRACGRFAMPVTERLADSNLALPFSVDMVQEDVDYVVRELCTVF